MSTVVCAQSEGTVDTQSVPLSTATKKKWRRTIKKRRDTVEETLVPEASVARVARQHDVNANQVSVASTV